MDIKVVIGQMIVLFALMGLGFLLYRVNILDLNTNSKLTSLVLSVTTPCMVLNSVLCTEKYSDSKTIFTILGIAVVTYVITPFIGMLINKLLHVQKNQTGLYVFMTVFSNIGFIGYPIMKAIFGNDSVFHTSLFGMVFNIMLFTLGVYLIGIGQQGNNKLNFKNLITPGVICSFLALILYLMHIRAPKIVTDFTGMVGDMTTPLAMIIIGVTLGAMNIKKVFNELRVYVYTLVKQLILPIIAYPIIAFLIKDHYLRGLTLIMLSMPVGSSAVLFTNKYGGDSELAAKKIFMTTLISVFTIPLVVYMFLI